MLISSNMRTPPRGALTVNCLLGCLQEAEFPRPLKRSSGIPNSFMEPVKDMNQPGAMLTSSGQLAVPTLDAYVLLLSNSNCITSLVAITEFSSDAC